MTSKENKEHPMKTTKVGRLPTPARGELDRVMSYALDKEMWQLELCKCIEMLHADVFISC